MIGVQSARMIEPKRRDHEGCFGPIPYSTIVVFFAFVRVFFLRLVMLARSTMP